MPDGFPLIFIVIAIVIGLIIQYLLVRDAVVKALRMHHQWLQSQTTTPS